MWSEKLVTSKDSYNKNSSRLKELIHERDSILNSKEFYAYTMIHQYRAKNGFGAIDVGRIVFYFDKDITKVKDTESE
ncbi:MAG: hypothetical protein FWF53_06925 [Candidatus Azobacteroides sp.]|nr:hypothetical protein [Candidatus Azobacteroides sp.]